MSRREQSCSDEKAQALERESCPERGDASRTHPAETPALESTQAERELVRRAKTYIASREEQRIGLAQVSRALRVSGPYLTAAFRKVEGLPLYRYLRLLRLRRALRLLPERENLSQLAQELGFSSHSHFTTAFQRTFGCVPTFFRARARAVCRTLRLRSRIAP